MLCNVEEIILWINFWLLIIKKWSFLMEGGGGIFFSIFVLFIIVNF